MVPCRESQAFDAVKGQLRVAVVQAPHGHKALSLYHADDSAALGNGEHILDLMRSCPLDDVVQPDQQSAPFLQASKTLFFAIIFAPRRKHNMRMSGF